MTRVETVQLLSTARGILDASTTLECRMGSMWCAETTDPANSHIGISVDLDDDDNLIYDAIVTDSREALETWKAQFDDQDDLENDDFEPDIDDPIPPLPGDEIPLDVIQFEADLERLP